MTTSDERRKLLGWFTSMVSEYDRATKNDSSIFYDDSFSKIYAIIQAPCPTPRLKVTKEKMGFIIQQILDAPWRETIQEECFRMMTEWLRSIGVDVEGPK
jgi:hypothetical protein